MKQKYLVGNLPRMCHVSGAKHLRRWAKETRPTRDTPRDCLSRSGCAAVSVEMLPEVVGVVEQEQTVVNSQHTHNRCPPVYTYHRSGTLIWKPVPASGVHPGEWMRWGSPGGGPGWQSSSASCSYNYTRGSWLWGAVGGEGRDLPAIGWGLTQGGYGHLRWESPRPSGLWSLPHVLRVQMVQICLFKGTSAKLILISSGLWGVIKILRSER